MWDMQAQHQHPAHPKQRPPLRLNAVDWAIYLSVAVCMLGGWAITCSWTSDVGQCIRDGAPALLGVLLSAGALVLAVWTGSEIGHRSGSTTAGLACGVLLFFVLSALLTWLGFGPTR